MTTLILRNFSLAALFAGALMAGAPEGKALYTAKCQGCHGANGEGKEAIAKMFNVKMMPLGSKEVQAKPDAELQAVITAGKGKMKAISGLTAAQAGDIVAYVRTLKK